MSLFTHKKDSPSRKLGSILLSPFAALLLLLVSVQLDIYFSQTITYLLSQLFSLIALTTVTIDLKRRIPFKLGKSKLPLMVVYYPLLLVLSFSTFRRLGLNDANSIIGVVVVGLLVWIQTYVIIKLHKPRLPWRV